jgi:hypothetical protein
MTLYTVPLVDEIFYQAAVAKLSVRSEVRLVPDPDNARGTRTVKCTTTDGETVGYLDNDSPLVGTIIDERLPVTARVKEIIGRVAKLPVHGVVLEVRVEKAPKPQAATIAPQAAGISRGSLLDNLGVPGFGLLLLGAGAAYYFLAG